MREGLLVRGAELRLSFVSLSQNSKFEADRGLKTADTLYYRGFSSVGRASDLHSEGQEFESPSLHAYAVIAQLVRARH